MQGNIIKIKDTTIGIKYVLFYTQWELPSPWRGSCLQPTTSAPPPSASTTYMYLIAILIYVKLYQNRHPDMSANLIQAYLVLGGAIVLEAISIYCQNSATFWTFFCLVYMVSLVFLVANIYQMGSSTPICQNCSEKCKSCIDKEVCRCKCKCHKRYLFIRVFMLLADESMTAVGKVYHGKFHRIRPLLLFISTTFCINVALCAYFAWNATQKDVTASNYLLYLFIINMAIYLAYYISMKMLSGEKLSHLALWYLGKLSKETFVCTTTVITTNILSSACKPVFHPRNVVLCEQGEELQCDPGGVPGEKPTLHIFGLL